MTMKLLFQIVLLLALSGICHGQHIGDTSHEYVDLDSTIINLTHKECSRFVKCSIRRAERMARSLETTNNKYLHLFMKEEDILLHSLCKLSPKETSEKLNPEASSPISSIHSVEQIELRREVQANALIYDAWQSFNRFENLCERNRNKETARPLTELDSLDDVTRFLTSPNCGCQIASGGSLVKANSDLRFQIKRSELIQEYVQEREKFLTQVLKNSTGGSIKMLPIRKCSYYLTSQVNEYFRIFKDKSTFERSITSKFESLAVFDQPIHRDLLSNMPLRTQLSQPELKIADLLKDAPTDTKTTLESMSGLVKNTALKVDSNLLSAREQAGNVESKLRQPQTMKEEVDSLKNTTNQCMHKEKDSSPWCPNPLKTKRFIDRLAFGSNIQFDNRTQFFPSTAILAVQFSYQLHKRSSIGIGSSYLMAFGKRPRSNTLISYELLNVERIFRHNGFGYKACIDFRVLGRVYAAGSFEQYLRIQEGGFEWNNVSQADPNIWQRSCLIGIKAKVNTSKRSQQTTEILYDFLSDGTRPAIVIRTGVEFRGKHSIKPNY